MMPTRTLHTQCCIAGGGPAGMMLGFLLARAGVEVVVLEKHIDFLRDFRGDTVHPSTLEVMHELGLLEEFLQLPHQKTYRLNGMIGDLGVTMADFSRLNVHAPYIAFMPQWDFLNFLAGKAAAYPNFRLCMQAQASELIMDGNTVSGVRAITPEGTLEIHSKLLVAADGRHSALRDLAGLRVLDYGAPIDVLWFRLPRLTTDTQETVGRFMPGSLMVMINRGDYWQCGYVIAKGRLESLQQEGLAAFRRHIADNAPFVQDRLHLLENWDQIKLLTVRVDCLEQWHRDGLLCIGDAAHAMSPVGGVGINLAVQDAVAAANILAGPLLAGPVSPQQLAQVQKRRMWPARMTQRLQIFMHKRVIYRVLQSNRPFAPPLFLRYLLTLGIFRGFTARLIGIGFRAEHIAK